MIPINLKKFESQDVDILLGFVERYYDFDGIAFEVESVKRSLSTMLGDASIGRAWSFEVEGQLIGYAVLSFGFDHEVGGRIATLTDFYLEPDFRGKGLGKLALEKIEEECLQLGLAAIELQVEQGNQRARKLYGNLNFRAFDRIPMFKRLKGPNNS